MNEYHSIPAECFLRASPNQLEKIMLGKRIARTRGCAAFVIILSLVALVVIIPLARASFDITKLANAIVDPGFVSFVVNLVLALVLGVLASFVYGKIENSAYKAELVEIQNLTDPELLEQILQNASRYGDNVCADRSIRYTLERTQHKDILQLIGDYSYRRKIDSHYLTLRFVRLRSQNDVEANRQMASALSEKLRTAEFYFIMDEVEFREDLGIDALNPELDKYYLISDFRCDGIPMQLARVPGSDSEWCAQLPNSLEIGKEVVLSYRVASPITYTDYFFSNLTRPTKGNQISLDYSALSSELWVDVVEVFSGMESATSSSRDGNGKISVAQSGWAMARSGVVFVWSKI